MTNNFVQFILAITFFVTVFKLFVKPYWQQDFAWPLESFTFNNPTERALCPITGYRCLDERHCDCQQICGSSNFERVVVDDKNTTILSTIQREPGVYCVPKGLDKIIAHNTTLVHSAQGWSMVSKYAHIWNDKGQLVMCSNPYAQDNSKNVLYDQKENRPVQLGDIVDLTETHGNQLRYLCQCNSLDIRKNKMINIPEAFPFACLTDHCKSERVGAGFPGWDGNKCDCGPRMKHADPLDETSPCVDINVHFKDNQKCTFFVPCVDKYNLDSGNLFYCPDTYNTDQPNVVSFDKILTFNETNVYKIVKDTYSLYAK